MHETGADRDPVPDVDGADCHDQLRDLPGREMRLQPVIGGIRCAGPGDQGNAFSPFEDCALPLIEERGFAPDRDEMQLLRRNSICKGLATCMSTQ